MYSTLFNDATIQHSVQEQLIPHFSALIHINLIFPSPSQYMKWVVPFMFSGQSDVLAIILMGVTRSLQQKYTLSSLSFLLKMQGAGPSKTLLRLHQIRTGHIRPLRENLKTKNFKIIHTSLSTSYKFSPSARFPPISLSSKYIPPKYFPPMQTQRSPRNMPWYSRGGGGVNPSASLTTFI